MSYEPGLLLLGVLPWDADGVVVDVGANRGQSIDAVRRIRPDVRIEAFEANPSLSRQLERRYADCPEIRVHHCGLGDLAGNFTLHVPVYRRHAFDGLAALDAADAADEFHEWVYGFSEGHLSLQQVECRLGVLDDMDLKPVFVKIDVEGHELAVLRGARRTLAAFEPVVMVEAIESGEEVASLLGELGYERCELSELLPGAGGPPGPNLLFVTPARRATLAGNPGV